MKPLTDTEATAVVKESITRIVPDADFTWSATSRRQGAGAVAR
ncbi:hypothetical protein [Streptomyces sasae]|nr:hypothetical protein [Streptomyces sasae]